jgi:hypothetical protein
VNEPTPDEAAAALRTVHEGRERVIRSAVGSRWQSIVGGLIVFLYCTAIDLFPGRTLLGWPVLVLVLVLVLGLHTRVGSTLLGRPVVVSDRSLSVTFTGRLLRLAPLLGVVIAVILIIQLFHVRHGVLYYGALVGLYIIFLGPRFQLWLLRRKDKD